MVAGGAGDEDFPGMPSLGDCMDQAAWSRATLLEIMPTF